MKMSVKTKSLSPYTMSTYPRSRLFKMYDAQKASETKPFPRSRLFRSEVRNEQPEVRMISISVDELFRLATDYENKTSRLISVEKKVRKLNPAWESDEMDEACDFSKPLFI
jgi:hypothetical protein